MASRGDEWIYMVVNGFVWCDMNYLCRVMMNFMWCDDEFLLYGEVPAGRVGFGMICCTKDCNPVNV